MRGISGADTAVIEKFTSVEIPEEGHTIGTDNPTTVYSIHVYTVYMYIHVHVCL